MAEHRLIPAGRFFTPAKLHQILIEWGTQVRVFGDATPEGWGWPSQTVDPRQMARATDGSGLTMPEAACYKLKKQRADIETIARLVRDLPLVQKYALANKYVHQMASDDIALQLGLTVRCVHDALVKARAHVREGLCALRENVRVRAEAGFHDRKTGT